MRPYAVTAALQRRILARRGRLHAIERIDPAQAAVLVVDMQRYFLAPGAAGEVPAARVLVPAINTLTGTVRERGGAVVWIRTSSARTSQLWARHQRHGLSPAFARRRAEGLSPDGEGFALDPALDVRPADLQLTKTHYSAFAAGTDLHATLRWLGVEILLVCGTATNVCCESTARDAMMLDYRVAMVSDACAAWTDREHRAALDTFALMFGDVLTVEQVGQRLA